MDPAAGAPAEVAPEAQGAPMEGGQPAGGAEEQLAQIAQQLLQMLLQELQDPNVVAMVLQAALEMLAQSSQGAEQGQPVFKKGGKICKKAKCGIKMKK